MEVVVVCRTFILLACNPQKACFVHCFAKSFNPFRGYTIFPNRYLVHHEMGIWVTCCKILNMTEKLSYCFLGCKITKVILIQGLLGYFFFYLEICCVMIATMCFLTRIFQLCVYLFKTSFSNSYIGKIKCGKIILKNLTVGYSIR